MEVSESPLGPQPWGTSAPWAGIMKSVVAEGRTDVMRSHHGGVLELQLTALRNALYLPGEKERQHEWQWRLCLSPEIT